MKPCIKCKQVKPIEDFYAHPKMGDGHLNKCKTCCIEFAAAHVEKLKVDPHWVAKERCRSRDKSKRYRIRGITFATSREVRKRWAARNERKRKAQHAANNAVRDGRLERKYNCEKCGASGDLEKHHEDYSKPLDVQWLCTKCHGETRHKPFGSPMEK